MKKSNRLSRAVFSCPKRGETMENYRIPIISENNFLTYVCWLLSRKHYGKNKKYRKKG